MLIIFEIRYPDGEIRHNHGTKKDKLERVGLLLHIFTLEECNFYHHIYLFFFHYLKILDGYTFGFIQYLGHRFEEIRILRLIPLFSYL